MKTLLRSGLNISSLTTILCTGALILSGCMASDNRSDTSGQCPQPRDTELASAHIASKHNPLMSSRENINAGEELFQDSAEPVACAQCHGKRGNGNGPMAKMFNPAPRDFTCAQTMAAIPDGQLYWIIKSGSIGTSMPAFNKLNDDQIWQLVSYLREFSREAQKLTKK
jgi:mono/diheme cytochrome c family protein